MYLPTASDDNDQYQHLPAMPGPSAMRFHPFALASSQLYIMCTFAKVTLLSKQLILGPNVCSTLPFLSIIHSWSIEIHVISGSMHSHQVWCVFGIYSVCSKQCLPPTVAPLPSIPSSTSLPSSAPVPASPGVPWIPTISVQVHPTVTMTMIVTMVMVCSYHGNNILHQVARIEK